MISIALPFPSPSQNELGRWHFGKIKKHRETLEWIVRQRMATAGFTPPWQPIPPGARRSHQPLLGVAGGHTRARIERYSSGTLDHGNMVGGCKHLVDAMVLQGLVFDDSPQWFTAEYLQTKTARGKGSTVITLRWEGADG